MEFWQSLNGIIQAELVCADPAFALTVLHNKGISVQDVRYRDDFTIRFRIRRQQIKKLEILSQKHGFELRSVKRKGLYWVLRNMLHRPILTVGMLFFLLISLILPTRIFFFQVEGNSTVSTRLILETAAQCGITFGASRSEVRSEKMKNALLEALPQLQWAGINTSGCVAVISVRERQETQAPDRQISVGSIVAIRDGVITQCTATKGNLVCKPGQAVKAGQVLISGYTDCGLKIQATCAEGEVYGRTERSITVICPTEYEKRGQTEVIVKKYSLIIGKKRINLYFGSGISDATCVKMYEQKELTLPGGFRLPVALVTEIWTSYGDCQSQEAVPEEAQMSAFAQAQLLQEMTAGRILSAGETVYSENGVSILEGRYACLELIGQLRSEEIIEPNGTND